MMSKTALSSGNLNRNGARQIEVPKPLLLATNSGSNEASCVPSFLVPIPDARLKVKITVAFVPTAGNPIPVPSIMNSQSIWISAADYEANGVGGGGGRVLPITDLVGTQAAPQTFPTSAGLVGYSQSFVTIADVIQVVPNLSSIAGGPATSGAWMAFTRFQPHTVEFSSFEEWDAVRRLCLPQIVGITGAL